MIGLEDIQSGLSNVVGVAKEFITENPLKTAVGAGVIGAGVIGSAVAISRARAKKKTKKRAKRTAKSKGRSRDRIFMSKQKHESSYKRKRKYKVYGKKGWIYPSGSKGKKRVGQIYRTKNGQPYKILASGKARFIKRKGGKK